MDVAVRATRTTAGTTSGLISRSKPKRIEAMITANTTPGRTTASQTVMSPAGNTTRGMGSERMYASVPSVLAAATSCGAPPRGPS